MSSSADSSIRCTCEARQAEKLKDSCDACARAKTKCDRDPNGCQRCKRRGEDCHYSRARRIGKHRATCATSIAAKARKEAALQAQNNLHQHGGRSGSISSISRSPPLMPSVLEYTSSPFGSTLSTTESMTSPSMRYQDTIKEPTIDITEASFLMGMDNGSLEHHLNGVDAFMSDAWLSSETPNLSTSSTSTNVDDLMSGFPFPDLNPSLLDNPSYPLKQSRYPQLSSSHGQECTRLACSTLHSLHLPMTSCSSAGSYFDPSKSVAQYSMDQILENNKAAIQNLQTIMNCPCSLDTNLALLCSLITTKILESYKLGQRSKNNVATPGGTLLDLPISIGNYQLDQNSKAKVFAQIVLTDLIRVRSLVEMSVKRYSSLEQDTSGQLSLCSTLMRSVQERVESTIAELTAELEGP